MPRSSWALRPTKLSSEILFLDEANNRTKRWATAISNIIESQPNSVQNQHVLSWIRRSFAMKPLITFKEKSRKLTLKEPNFASNPTVRELAHIANSVYRLPSTIISTSYDLQPQDMTTHSINPDHLFAACITVSDTIRSHSVNWAIINRLHTHRELNLTHILAACHEQNYDPVEFMKLAEKFAAQGLWS